MMLFSSLVALVACGTAVAASESDVPPSAYTAPGTFPTSVYGTFWNDPIATSAQPQPVITDPVTVRNKVLAVICTQQTIAIAYHFPEELTDPETFPKNDTVDPHPLPPASAPSELLTVAIEQIKAIANNSAFEGNECAQCLASLEVAKFLVMAAPEQGSPLAQAMCSYFDYTEDCEAAFSVLSLGYIISQVVALADVGGYDGQNLCSDFNLCSIPPTVPLNMTGWFAKPKPNPLPAPTQPSGERLKILHISDIHMDPRYATGSEANCTSQGLCCRDNAYNLDYPDQILSPAPRYGAYLCDTPIELMFSVLPAIPKLTGTEETGFNFTLFTGDLTAHDPKSEYSRYVGPVTRVIIYNALKQYVGPAPVYATVGNHDTYMEYMMMPYQVGGYLGGQFNWSYEHISSLWSYEGWLPEESVEFARTHYAGYTVKRPDGLRIISLDTNMWFENRNNYLGYINSTNPDQFGLLRWLTDELQEAEDAGDRAWIMGHVLAGFSGKDAQSDPTNLCTVDRYSPHVIANIFWGHTHEDQLSIFYANNGTVMNADTALAVSWQPQLRFRMYEVDSAVGDFQQSSGAAKLTSGLFKTFEVLDSYTWISRINEYPELDNQTEYGPTYELEYSAREAYGQNITWGTNDPLNATWWHLVTEQMEYDSSLVKLFNKYQYKSAIVREKCTGKCIPETICYMRSGSAPLALQNC
ncbi:sphingomyelin phosphodiesterase [Chiua virens]|nr:sphingomyelin phosphodiesterase [Chiua virens]